MSSRGVQEQLLGVPNLGSQTRALRDQDVLFRALVLLWGASQACDSRFIRSLRSSRIRLNISSATCRADISFQRCSIRPTNTCCFDRFPRRARLASCSSCSGLSRKLIAISRRHRNGTIVARSENKRHTRRKLWHAYRRIMGQPLTDSATQPGCTTATA